MDEGRIIERGSHDELIALGGRYRELYDLQSSPTDTRPLREQAALGRPALDGPALDGAEE
jgi:ATP-binding cassette subfamily B protein